MIVIAVGDDDSVLDMYFGLSEVSMGVSLQVGKFLLKTKDRDRKGEFNRERYTAIKTLFM
jgi:hypothetical protein